MRADCFTACRYLRANLAAAYQVSSLPALDIGATKVSPVWRGSVTALFIDRDGVVQQFVPFDRPAWHAGESQWMNRQGCRFSLGIEIEGMGIPLC